MNREMEFGGKRRTDPARSGVPSAAGPAGQMQPDGVCWHHSTNGNVTPEDLYRPHPNFDDGINRAICQSEIDGGIDLNEVPSGTELEVVTHYHTYRVIYEGNGEMTISGHPDICPRPVRVHLAGSTWGTPMLKLRFIGRGMKMEFVHPLHGIIQTSRVKDIREVSVSLAS